MTVVFVQLFGISAGVLVGSQSFTELAVQDDVPEGMSVPLGFVNKLMVCEAPITPEVSSGKFLGPAVHSVERTVSRTISVPDET